MDDVQAGSNTVSTDGEALDRFATEGLLSHSLGLRLERLVEVLGVGGAMSKEQTSSVTFRVPDFIDADGIEYTDIEVIVETDSDIRRPPTSLRRCSVP